MRTKALFAAVLTTLLWSGSYILNRIAFDQGIGPLTLSGIRYTVAALALLLAMRDPGQGRQEQFPLAWPRAAAMGLVSYGVGQGFQYIGQSHLTPTMASLLMNAGMMLAILLIDRVQLREHTPKSLYWKALLLLLGIWLYNRPLPQAEETVSATGVVFMLLAAIGAALNITMNRHMLKNRNINRKQLTVKPMLCGGVAMLGAGLLRERLPGFTLSLWLIIAYLALISGALGFSLWVWSQRYLSAVESGSINNAMLIETALLDALCFGRTLGGWKWCGILMVFAAITLIQVKREA